MKTQVILAAAGVGKRFGAEKPKTLVMLKDKPIFIWSLLAFEKNPNIHSTVLVVHSDYLQEYKTLRDEFGRTQTVKLVAGGETRSDSVNNGLAALDSDTEIVLVHDGARPLIDQDTIEKSINLCKENGAVIVAVPVKPTIKKVGSDGFVKETLNREELWEVQTPQVFKKEILVRAHQNRSGLIPTDDATLVEELGVKVKVLKGDYRNIKVTTQDDLLAAEAFLKEGT